MIWEPKGNVSVDSHLHNAILEAATRIISADVNNATNFFIDIANSQTVARLHILPSQRTISSFICIVSGSVEARIRTILVVSKIGIPITDPIKCCAIVAIVYIAARLLGIRDIVPSVWSSHVKIGAKIAIHEKPIATNSHILTNVLLIEHHVLIARTRLADRPGARNHKWINLPLVDTLAIISTM